MVDVHLRLDTLTLLRIYLIWYTIVHLAELNPPLTNWLLPADRLLVVELRL